MSAISLKSITGITSITTPAGVDDQLTLHTNNTTERVKIDVAGNVHVNNQLSVAGVTTFASHAYFGNNVRAIFAANNRLQILSNGTNSYLDYAGSLNVRGNSGSAAALSFLSDSNVLVSNNLSINGDLDVDGHTNLDNVSVAGVTTVANDTYLTFGANATANSNLRIKHNSSSTRNEYRATYQDFFTTDLRIHNISNNAHFAYFWSNQISLFASGSERLQVNNSGAKVLGNLELSSSYPSLTWTDTNHNSDFRITNDDGKLIFYDITNGAHRLDLYDTGNIKIYKDLEVDGHTNLDNVSVAGVTTFTGHIDASGDVYIADKIIHAGDTNTAIRFPTDDNISFEAGATGEVARFLPTNASSGGPRMGLGTNNPTGMLHIYGANPPFRIQNSNDSANLQIGMWDASNVMFQVSHRPFKLATETSHPIVFHTGGLNNERLRIDSSGRVMIGNTAAGQMFGGADDLIVGTTSGARGITIISENNTVGRLLFSDSLTSGAATYQGQVNYNHSTDTLDLRTYTLGSITLSTSNTERLTINSGGDVTVNTGTLYIPQWISHVSDTDSKFGFPQPDIIEFQVAGTQRLKIMNTGQIRIDQGTSANNGIRMRPSGWNYDFRIGAVSSSGGSIWLGQNYEPTGGTRDSATYGTNYIRFTTQGEILFGTGATNTNPTQRLKIKSDGTLNVGNADSVAPWGATGNVNSGVRLINNGLTGYAISANSNDIAGIFNRTNTQGTILECKYNGVVKHALGDNFTAFYGQQNTFRYDNAGGIGAYLSIMNRGASSAGTACGIAFGCDTSDAQVDGSDTGNGQIKVTNDGSDGGIMSFHVHTGANFEAMKIVGNLNSTRNATNGNSVALKGGVAFSTAGIAIDKSWDNYPGLHVFNATGHSDTNQGQFRFHGWNTSYNSYPQSSGADFSVNLVADGTGLTSDERRKTGISTITNALNTVSQLRGVKYTQVNRELKPQTHMTMDNGQKLGFIAQEVIPHLPSIVIDSGDHVQPMENGYCDRYMIDYGSVVALLTEAVKELKSKNEALEARIATLESS